MPCLTAVETGPSIVVGGGDLAGIALWGFQGVLALELCVRGLGACHLGSGPILHWGLRSWCSIVGVSWFLEAVLLAGLTFQELTLIFPPFFSFGPFYKDGHVHQSIEVWVYLRGKQGPEFWAQSLLEHALLLFILAHFLWCLAGKFHELVSVFFHRHAPLLQFAEFICLALHGGWSDMVATELFHKFIPSDGGGIFSSGTVILPPS